MRNTSKDYIKFTILLLAFILFFAVMAAYDTAVMREESLKPEPALIELQEQLGRLEADIQSLTESLNEFRAWLDKLNVGEFKATAYTYVLTPGVADINGTGDGITASGIPVQEGIIAVDPRVIPLGTKVWVEGFGVLLAADTGGAIKGNRIDVFMESREDALRWGIKTIKALYLEAAK